MSDRVNEIKARAEAATPGPWAWVKDDTPPAPGYRFGAIDGHNELGLTRSPFDAAFIAHAREDIPWLLAELAASREALAEALAAEIAAGTIGTGVASRIVAAARGDALASSSPERTPGTPT